MKLRLGSRKRRSVRSTLYILGIFFILFGGIFFGIGCGVLVSDMNFKKTADKTQAIILEIERYTYRSGGKTKTGRHVTIAYEVNGKDYVQELSEYNSSMRKGGEIGIYYNPDDPNDFRTCSLTMPAVFMGVGGFFMVLGSAFVISNIIYAKRRKDLMENGDVLTGTITAVNINRAVRINGRHPYKAECEVIDPFSSEKYLYSSQNVTNDISDLVGREVTVYVDKKDKSKYFVDIFELEKRYMEENNIHDYR